MKITVDLIEQCAQYTNAVKEREIDLRGYKISVIENMGATLVSCSLILVLVGLIRVVPVYIGSCLQSAHRIIPLVISIT